MQKHIFVWGGIAFILCAYLVPYMGLVHYLLPARGTPEEFPAWSTFLLWYYLYWFIWVPSLSYLLWRLLRVIKSAA